MIVIHNVNDWWAVLLKNQLVLTELIRMYHPIFRQTKEFDETISAPAAEALCEIIRQEVVEEFHSSDPIACFDEAIESRDYAALLTLLNQTWFGLPESYSSRQLPGFDALCELCSESWVFAEDEPAPIYEPENEQTGI